MKTLNKEQERKLEEAFEAICNMSFASEKDNHSLCGTFHIQPFDTHWDKKTVKEVMYQVKLYIDTWVVYPMSVGLQLSRNKIELERRKEHKQAKKRLKEFRSKKPEILNF